MSRYMFGWDLPPGVTMRMIEELTEEGPCQVCGLYLEMTPVPGFAVPPVCKCPECPECKVAGDPRCAINKGPGCREDN
jgi:hypothetical protein